MARYKKWRYEWCDDYCGSSKGYYVRVFTKYGKTCRYKFVVAAQTDKSPKQTIEAALDNLARNLLLN